MMDAFQAALEHARAEAPKESCGFIAGGEYIACENKHSDPENFFRIDDPRFDAAMIANQVKAVVHSHPKGPSEPSAFDTQVASVLGVPSFLIAFDRILQVPTS
jgi:proteasome lid subunit RPN8/RPN11